MKNLLKKICDSTLFMAIVIFGIISLIIAIMYAIITFVPYGPIVLVLLLVFFMCYKIALACKEFNDDW